MQDAVNKVYWDWGNLLPVSSDTIAAAVLRAVAEQIEDLYCESDVDSSDGVVFAMRQLVLIADELEGVKYGTYRCDLKDK